MFERLDCQPVKSSKILVKDCSMKKISRIGTDRANVSLEFIILKPLIGIQFHVTIFFKKQVYRKLPFEYSGDVCNYWNKKVPSPVLDWTMGRVMRMNLVEYDHKLECPLKEGNLSIKMNNISMNEKFPLVPLLPSGQYRVDTVAWEGQRHAVFLRSRYYLAISDKRVEQYDNFDDLTEFKN